MELPQDYIKCKVKTTIKGDFRYKDKQKLPRPDEPADLRKLIEAQDPQPPCSCDICDPARYKAHRNCPLFLHSHPKLKISRDKNQYGNECYKPLHLNSALRGEALELARTTIQYFDRPFDQLNNTQLAALHSLQEWIRNHMSLIFISPPPPTTSLADLFTEKEMQTLWTHINTLFFGISIPSKLKVFQWTSPSDEKDVVGVASKGRFRYYIKMSPVYLPHRGSDGLMNRILDMLSTLLHEACHVFFRYTTCPCCSTFTGNLHNARGHGRAWQVLAEAVERCFTRFTGLPVELGRWVSIWCNWKDMVRLPSRHKV
jgi:hypothetical protein